MSGLRPGTCVQVLLAAVPLHACYDVTTWQGARGVADGNDSVSVVNDIVVVNVFAVTQANMAVSPSPSSHPQMFTWS